LIYFFSVLEKFKLDIIERSTDGKTINQNNIVCPNTDFDQKEITLLGKKRKNDMNENIKNNLEEKSLKNNNKEEEKINIKNQGNLNL